MPAPLFTIGLSVYNAERFLRPCLASIFAQSFSDWELLVVDDGSADRSLTTVLAIRDARVRVLSDGRNLGLAPRLNQLVREAKGRYFVRMDADDLMHPNRLATLAAALPPPTVPLVIGSLAYVIDEHNAIHGVRGGPPGRGWAVRHAFVHPTVAAAVEWFRANPYREEESLRRCEDAELWCRTAGTTRFQVLPQALLYYREVGVFQLANYLATQRGLHQVVRRHFAEPPDRRVRLHLGILLKGLAYRLATTCGQSDRLVRRRSRPLAEEQRLEAEDGLRLAISTWVPGLGD